MRKRIIVFALFIASAALLSACSLKQINKESVTTNVQVSSDKRQLDFGQPEENADITGLVKSITGNQATIIKIERPERTASSTDATKQNNGASQAPTITTSLGGSGGARGGMGGGGQWQGGPAGGGMEGGQTEESRIAMLKRIKEMSTGEEVVIIPVGIQMLKIITDSDNKSTSVEASLSDITADKMVRIWVDKSITDKKVASFVMITN